jgi:hypothetical protein
MMAVRSGQCKVSQKRRLQLRSWMLTHSCRPLLPVISCSSPPLRSSAICAVDKALAVQSWSALMAELSGYEPRSESSVNSDLSPMSKVGITHAHSVRSGESLVGLCHLCFPSAELVLPGPQRSKSSSQCRCFRGQSLTADVAPAPLGFGKASCRG